MKKNKILFVGTPCQVGGLKSFIKNDFNHLMCIDLICHGVPSPRLFEKYIEELEDIHNDKVINYNFRDKCTGWDSYSNTVTYKNSEYSELQSHNNYMKLYLSDIALRESCYNCHFKLGNKYSDITLGDFWGIRKYYPEMYNKKGVSAIIINTEIGKKIFENISSKLIFKECKLSEIVEGNPSLKESSKQPEKRYEFFKDLETTKINNLTQKYIKEIPYCKKFICKIKSIIKRMVN